MPVKTALIALCATLVATSAWAGGFLCAGQVSPDVVAPPYPGPAKTTQAQIASTSTGIVLFAHFKDEMPADAVAPEWAQDLFDPDRPGSISHFYDTMSFGTHMLRGEVVPTWYESRHGVSAYLSESSLEIGQFGLFALEILRKADDDVDFARFDNDGPDGIPNSGDDDGFVDAVFIALRSAPRDFLLGAATGISSLGLRSAYVTADEGASGEAIQVFSGTIQAGGSYAALAGTICHEYGHLLGLPDLLNTQFIRSEEPLGPADDSAGIGSWGLMGWGALGWNGDDGPLSLGAWSREQLGWAQVIEFNEDEDGIRVEDVGETGTIYKLPVRTPWALTHEYFLLENRQRDSNYHDRNIPGEGLLIWHFDRGAVVDVECADGRWRDAGYPRGDQADPQEGSDNLDFWAHNQVYSDQFGGNRGDATDPFDGDRFTLFAPETNPSSLSTDGHNSVVVRVHADDDGALSVDVQAAAPLLEITNVSVEPDLGGGSVFVDVELSVEFTVHNSGGSTATDLSVHLRSSDTFVQLVNAQSSLPDLVPGRSKAVIASTPVTFRVDRDLGQSHEASVTLEIRSMERLLISRELTVMAHTAYMISGSVLGEAGESISNVVVTAYSSESGVRVAATTDESGRYELFAPPGEYAISAREEAPRSEWGRIRTHISVHSDVVHDIVLPGRFTLSGTVTGPDGIAIDGLLVLAHSSFHTVTMTTSDDGSFVVTIPAGVYWITTSPDPRGFVGSEAGPVDVNGDVEFDITLEGGVLVTVHLVSEAGANVSQAAVRLTSTQAPRTLRSRFTRSNGNATFVVLPGSYTVTVPQPLVGLEPEPVLIEAANDTIVQIHLTNGPQISGSVVRQDGSRVGSGSVVFYSEREGKETKARVSDGSYSLMIPSGEYDVSVQDGVYQHHGDVIVYGDTTLGFVVDSRVAVSGGITGRKEGELEGTRIQFQSLEGKGTGGPQAAVSSSAFALDVAPGLYRVVLSGGGASTIVDPRLRVDGSMGDLRFDMKRNHFVTGHLAEDAAEVPAGVHVSFTSVNGSHRAGQDLDANGLFEVILLEGDYRVELSATTVEQRTTWPLGPVEVPHEGALELSPTQGGIMTGRVTGLSTSGRVWIWLMRSPHELRLRGLDDYIASTVSFDGSYHLEAASGTYDVAFFGDGLLGRVLKDVELSDVQERDFQMPDPGVTHRVWGEVLDAEAIPSSGVQLLFYSEQHDRLVLRWGTEQGMYTADLPPGAYTVTAKQWSGLDYAPAISLGTIDVTGDRRHDLRPSVTVVTDAPTGPLPSRTQLGQNYPNPFNSTTSVRFSLEHEGDVTLALYNLLGQRVRKLVEGRVASGAQVVTWDGRDDNGRVLATGVYIYRLETGGGILVRKLLLLK